MVADTGRARHPDLTLMATPRTITTLKGGAVSIVFHVSADLADKAFQIHELLDKGVALDLYALED